MNLLIIKELRWRQRALHRKGRREEVAVDVKTPLFSLTVSLRLSVFSPSASDFSINSKRCVVR
jgi:hypothetical protein